MLVYTDDAAQDYIRARTPAPQEEQFEAFTQEGHWLTLASRGDSYTQETPEREPVDQIKRRSILQRARDDGSYLREQCHLALIQELLGRWFSTYEKTNADGAEYEDHFLAIYQAGSGRAYLDRKSESLRCYGFLP